MDCLAERSAKAMGLFSARHAPKERIALPFVIAGGVAANQALRKRLADIAEQDGFILQVAPPALCTDNAAMIAWAGAERLAAGQLTEQPMAAPARARWPLADLTD